MLSTIREIYSLPTIKVNLHYKESENNHPFFRNLVWDFYRDSTRWHPKYLIIPKYAIGIAACDLPLEFDNYFASIASPARQNYRKASRLGYTVKRIDFNEHLNDIQEIRSSAVNRQGRMPDSYLSKTVERCADPLSINQTHDYPYFGTLKNGKLHAYAGCFVSGNLCMIQHILGHAASQRDCVVPMLIIEIAKSMILHYPLVHTYAYGTYYGAKPEMQRFKSKFQFKPKKIKWILG